MSGVKRIYVAKKPAYAVKDRELMSEIPGYLGIRGVKSVRVYIRYDVEKVSEEVFETALRCVFSEPPVDELYPEEIPIPEGARVFGVEYLPGQYDQRADSAEQCIRFLKEDEEPVIRTAVTYVIDGDISDDEYERIRQYCINPVDSRETGMEKPETLISHYDEPADVAVFDGFRDMEDGDFKRLYDSLGLAMTYKDFLHIRNYFREKEKRDPSMTEIRVLDTYWSDHCRHTTFATELGEVSFGEGYYKTPLETTYMSYLDTRTELYGDREDKYVCLMDLALIAMKKLKSDGILKDVEESDEINACSIVVPVEITPGDGTAPYTEEWLISFKNETHNHPTEIEPFGGAATCLGGAIRDPLSGRSYVYQAMRITGAADPTVPVADTLKGKLPQKKLVRGAAAGYSSYGNQIGLATGFVKELYHPGYVAKRMEIGAVMGAAPRKNVQRLTSEPGDVIILLGGRTGRDGCGGATGSSKAHTEQSIDQCGAEVQKGNAPTERKLQRLFRRPEVSRLIRKCNDFGAGGVSVAIGELADGLTVDLDLVPKKYAGLDGTELAISESQERMAVVVDPKDEAEFISYADEENLEATRVAVVTKEPRLVLRWRGRDVVNLSRAFLNTNGAHQECSVSVDIPEREDSPLTKPAVAAVAKALEDGDEKAAWLAELSDLNVCSQKGLVEMFDSSIGAASVLMPYGGKKQLTQTQVMVAKLPMNGTDQCDTATMMSYGFDPYLSSWSPYHGAIYAVLSSVSKIVASGGDYHGIHFTFQEYFRRMTENPERWSQPFAALLGAYDAQLGFGLASIGGKDSMSGTFGHIDVPPTLVSFAVDVAKVQDIVTPEFKRAGDKLLVFSVPKDEYDVPVYKDTLEIFDAVSGLIREGRAVAAYSLDAYGLPAAVANMGFGNGLGAELDAELSAEELFESRIGDIMVEMSAEDADAFLAGKTAAELPGRVELVGCVTEGDFVHGDMCLDGAEALKCWKAPLDPVFPALSAENPGDRKVDCEDKNYDQVRICKNKTAKPKVFIPVFPGSNCEYDSARAFERAGAEPVVRVFKNRTAEDIRDAAAVFAKEIAGAQIIMFPGGFSAGDEPDGSAKFFATAFRNAHMKEEVEKLLNERDGLVLGICNGFQALIKLGLVPEGRICGQDEQSPTLTFNTINRHISKMAYLRVCSNLSPWLRKAGLGKVYAVPASHGEGRFVATEEVYRRLYENGQIATRYCDLDGRVTMEEEWNINGSVYAVEGITSPDGRVYGKMCHAERRDRGVAINIYGEQDMQIFESGVEYFKC
ncbi:MAG: phosphoribosylformylglycinamidine synthase [Lachnospiraceae bacterium]|nr:phosphoribosylformylglycinamidine synthase [Lachnospiraceae bacterium]